MTVEQSNLGGEKQLSSADIQIPTPIIYLYSLSSRYSVQTPHFLKKLL